MACLWKAGCCSEVALSNEQPDNYADSQGQGIFSSASFISTSGDLMSLPHIHKGSFGECAQFRGLVMDSGPWYKDSHDWEGLGHFMEGNGGLHREL